MNKVLLVDKPAGWTSFDVVAKIRSHFSKLTGKKVKVGHAGTLDPFATGLLIVLIGEATKKQDDYMKKDKEYVATLNLGFISSTGDPEGEVSQIDESSYKQPSLREVENSIKQFVGTIDQIPPKYSAIKINGKRAYELARAGKEVVIKPRKITVYELTVLEYSWPKLIIKAKVSSGTYIRTLAEDVGQSLGTGAYLTELRRTKIGEFDLSDSLTVDEIVKAL